MIFSGPSSAPGCAPAKADKPPAGRGAWQRWRQSSANWLRTLRDAFSRRQPLRPTNPHREAKAQPDGDARFTEGRSGHASSRRFMLYEPASRAATGAPLLVLLHGCKQSAAEFAAATRMNEAAEDDGVVVLYPEQSFAANPMRCWNWYALQDPSFLDGDAPLVAAMTREVIAQYRIDPARVYVAGMSAGGAMAAVLARDYPQLYAALGVHSGVPAGLAHNMASAMRLMASGPTIAVDGPAAAESSGAATAKATIVFHGDADATVHPSNGEAIHAGDRLVRRSMPELESKQTTTPASDGRRGFTRTVQTDAGGTSQRELWIVHGAGHAWMGGNADRPHADADGPDASREMLRFLLQHRLASSTPETSP